MQSLFTGIAGIERGPCVPAPGRGRVSGTALALVAAWFVLCALFAPLAAARAQDGAADDLGEAAGPVRELRAVKDKTVIFVFDVSGSMRGENLRRARLATANILRDGVLPGDRAVLFAFGAGYKKVFDEVVPNEAAKDDLIQQVPSQPVPGEGTNIRRPHYEALKILDAELPKPGAVILLTDSFNDEPTPSDPAYADYLRFYTPGGRLTKYPDTPENRDYERLLRKLTRSRKVEAYGIGIRIDEATGRPVERLPQQAHLDEAPAAATTAPEAAPPPPEKPGSPLPYVLGGGAALLALLAALFLAPLARASALRITGAPGGPRDFRLKSGQSVRLGGRGANFAADAYPIPGLDDPAAEVRASRGQLRLAPTRGAAAAAPKAGGATAAAAPAAPAAGGNPAAGPRVFHNGLPLEREEALSYGDEVRVSVPDPEGVGLGREFRLKFEDPRKSY